MHLIHTSDRLSDNGCPVPRLMSRLPGFLNGEQVAKTRKNWLVRTSGWLFVLSGLLSGQEGQAQRHTGLTDSPVNSTVLLTDNRSKSAARVQHLLSAGGAIADCPSITNTSQTAVDICSGQAVFYLEVNTTATDPPYTLEFVRFDSVQANPYMGQGGTPLAKNAPQDGKVVVWNVNFPANTTLRDRVHYVYVCLKPKPDNLSVCSPFALITVTVKPQPPKCLPVVIRRTKSSRNGLR